MHIISSVKSENEKGYYIVDAINEAINVGVKISFYYSELNGKKKAVKKPKGYNVSKYTAEVSRMFATDEAVDVTLLCDNCCMNDVVGMKGLLQNRVIIFPTPPFSLFRSCSSFLFIQNER